MLGMLAGDTLQSGPGRVYKDGVLGCIGCGSVLQSGPGVAYKDGSLGGPMATGPGAAYRDGSLGAFRRLRRSRLSGMRGLGLLTLDSDFFIGAALGAVGMFFLSRSKR